jgi:hypothetical protein
MKMGSYDYVGVLSGENAALTNLAGQMVELIGDDGAYASCGRVSW